MWRVGGVETESSAVNLAQFRREKQKRQEFKIFCRIPCEASHLILHFWFLYYVCNSTILLQRENMCIFSYFSWDNCRVFLAVLISPFCFGCVVDGVFEGHVLKRLLCFLLFSMVVKLIEPCNPLVMVVVDFPWNLFISLLNLYPCFITTLHNLQGQQNMPQIVIGQECIDPFMMN